MAQEAYMAEIELAMCREARAETRSARGVGIGVLALGVIPFFFSCTVAGSPDAGRIVQPGAPGAPSRVLESGDSPASSFPYADGDVLFMQGMIVHHAQALVMSGLAPGRTANADLRLIAQRIGRSQTDEIGIMTRWLSERGEVAPESPEALIGWDPAPGDPPMHGMASEDELRALANSSDDAFARMFLELMIRHHRGALAMIEELFAAPGAGLGGEVFQIASDAGSDQRIEIERMLRLAYDLEVVP